MADVVIISRTAADALLENQLVRSRVSVDRGRLQITHREQVVLQRLAEGFTQEQIANAENISPRTVERVVAILEQKLNAPCQFVLGMKAAQLDLVR